MGNDLGSLANLDSVQTPPDGTKIAKKSQGGGERRITRNHKPASKIQPGASLQMQSVADDALNSSDRKRGLYYKMKKVKPPSSSNRLLGRFRKHKEKRNHDFLDEANAKQSGDMYRQSGGEDGSLTRRIASTTPHRKKRRKDMPWRESNSVNENRFERQKLNGTPGTPLGSPPMGSNFDMNQVMGGYNSPQVSRWNDLEDDLSFGTQDEREVKCHNSSATKQRKNGMKIPSSEVIRLCESDSEDSKVGGEAASQSNVTNLGRSYRDIRNSPRPPVAFSKVNNKKPSRRSHSPAQKDDIESVSSRESPHERLVFNRIGTPYKLKDFEEGEHIRQQPGRKRKSSGETSTTPETSKMSGFSNLFNSCKQKITNVFSPRKQSERRSQRLRSFSRSPRKSAAKSNDVIELSSDEESMDLNDSEQLVDDRSSKMVSDAEMEFGEQSETNCPGKHLKSIYDEDEDSPRRSSRLSNQQIGRRVRCSASRIGVGSKVFDKGCVLQFQPSARRQFLRIEYENTFSSEVICHDIFVDDEEIKELYFYVPEALKKSTDVEEKKQDQDDGNNTKETPHVSIVDLQHDEGMTQEPQPVGNRTADSVEISRDASIPLKETCESNALKSSPNEKCSEPCYLIMRISPTRENNLAIYSNKYLTDENYPPDNVASELQLKKRFVVAEVHDNIAFLNLIDFMKKNDMLYSLLSGGEISLEQANEKITSLQPKRVKKVKTPIASKYKHDETILVFPFHAKDSELNDASKHLIEANGKLTSSEISTFFSKATTEDDVRIEQPQSQRVAKVHTVTIRGEDYDRLSPYEFLNDTLIDFWISWITKRMGETGKDVHVFTTQFFTKLEDEGVSAVSSWTAKKNLDIFEKKFILIPVNKDIHWSLFVVVNPGKIENGHDSTIENDDEVLEHSFCLFMDSLRAHKKNRMKNIIQNWLNAEAKRLGKFKRLGQIEPFNSQSFPVVDPRVPYQDNSWDCGVFVCRYAFSILRLINLPFAHSHSEWTDCNKRRSLVTKWISDSPEFQFNMNDIARLRIEMADLISNLSSIYMEKVELRNRKKKLLAEKKKNEENEKFEGESAGSMEV